MPAGQGRLESEAVGEVEKDGNVLILKRIHVTYRLRADVGLRDTIERAHDLHARYCPVARSIEGSIGITTSMEIEPLGEDPRS